MKSRQAWTTAMMMMMLTAGAQAETAQEVVARLGKKMKDLPSKSMVTTSEMTMKSPYMSMEQKTKTWSCEKDGKMLSRTESEGTQTLAGTKQDSKSLMVSDGKAMWTQTTADGMTQVFKADAPQTSAFDHEAMAAQFNTGEWTVKPSEKINGQECAVLEGKQGTGDEMVTTTMWFSEKTGVMLKMHTTGKAAGDTTVLVTDVQVGVTIPDDKFSYSPPAGAKVTDVSMGG